MNFRIVQEPSYHLFADDRYFLGIANAANTFSNIAFLVVGLLGLLYLHRGRAVSITRHSVVSRETAAWSVLFAAVALTGIGSAYYHLAPDDARLVWDRLPMSLAFGALVAGTVAERFCFSWSSQLLVGLLLLSSGSVFYWKWTGNLLPYMLVQYGSIAATLALVLLARSRYNHGILIFGVLALYMLAKAAEVLDAQIYAVGQFVSGHTLKHLLAAAAAYVLLRMLQSRRC